MTPAFGVEGRGGRGLIVRKIGAGTRPGRGHRGHGKSREAMCAQGCTIEYGWEAHGRAGNQGGARAGHRFHTRIIVLFSA